MSQAFLFDSLFQSDTINQSISQKIILKIILLDDAKTQSKITYQENWLENACVLYQQLWNNQNEEFPWRFDEYKIDGIVRQTKRKIIWYGDENYNYNYSGTSRFALPWHPIILKIKKQLETHTQQLFNSCLLNLYHDGHEGMAWHSDDQNHLIKNSTVAIISLGTPRFFRVKPINMKHQKRSEKIEDKNVIKQLLLPGSLLLMEGATQQYWLHEIPKMTTIHTPRISLTFRLIK